MFFPTQRVLAAGKALLAFAMCDILDELQQGFYTYLYYSSTIVERTV